jgi:hypothetical protein
MSRPAEFATVPRLQVVKRDGSLAWSPIYLFPHFQTTGERAFVRITTESNATVCTIREWLILTA